MKLYFRLLWGIKKTWFFCTLLFTLEGYWVVERWTWKIVPWAGLFVLGLIHIAMIILYFMDRSVRRELKKSK